MWFDVNVAISDMVRLKCKMCDVEYGVASVECGVQVCGRNCCIMKDVENYDVMWCGIVVMKNVAYAMCCVMSDVENEMQCVVMSDMVSVMRCIGIWCGVKYMVWCEIG